MLAKQFARVQIFRRPAHGSHPSRSRLSSIPNSRQTAAALRGKPGNQCRESCRNRHLPGCHDLFFHATRSFIHHQEHQTIGEVSPAHRKFLTPDSCTPFLQSFVRRLAVCLRICKTRRPIFGPAFSPRASFAEPEPDRAAQTPFPGSAAISTVISTPISSINRSGPIGIPQSSQRIVDLLGGYSGLKSSAASSRYGNSTRFTRKPGRILNQDRQFSDLPRKAERAIASFLRGVPCRRPLRSVSCG